MRDIRQDLKERIAEKRRQKAEHLANAERAEADIQALVRLSAEEEGRIVGNHVQLQFSAGAAKVNYCQPTVPLDEFLVKEIEREPKTKDELREAAAAAGYFVALSGSPGRVVHAKLLHLIRLKRVVAQTDGKMMTPKQVSDLAEENARGRSLATAGTFHGISHIFGGVTER